MEHFSKKLTLAVVVLVGAVIAFVAWTMLPTGTTDIDSGPLISSGTVTSISEDGLEVTISVEESKVFELDSSVAFDFSCGAETDVEELHQVYVGERVSIRHIGLTPNDSGAVEARSISEWNPESE